MSQPFLDTPIEYLKGVGPERAKMLKSELRIHSFGDLLNYFPFRYLDRTQFHKIKHLDADMPHVQLKGTITNLQTLGNPKNKRMVAQLQDDTGSLELVWFRGLKWLKNAVKPNTEYIVFGRPSQFNGRINLAHPELEEVKAAQTKMRATHQAFYFSTEKLKAKGLDTKGIARLMKNLLPQIKGKVPEILSDEIIQRNNFLSREQAYYQVHLPANDELLKRARLRLKFDELFFVQLRMVQLKIKNHQAYQGYKFGEIGDHFNTFYNQYLPFELTGAQKRVLKEIRRDVGSGRHMNRLLQGDVGSGKTVVALMTMLMALDNGFQACLMAPTEILATQHYETLTEMLEGMDVNIRLLTGSTKTAQRKIIHEELQNGQLHILIGTHALIEPKVVFKNLGMVIVDEQHRFGVAQRAKLWKKNTQPPHVLVMTATPIPRTLAMTIYGDLDTSVIDELPPGRKPIKTYHMTDAKRLKLFGFMKEQIKLGRQVYVVYPLIEESEKMDYKDLMDGMESIERAFPKPEYQVGIVHGRQKSEAKEFEMQRFQKGETQILVATTVIEVGVNVPNASVMVIESAERFGLSQLHQLRGRVGRGAEQSYCLLVTGKKLTDDGRIRMDTMCRTNDGFEIAEVDLQLRGPGDMAGTQQSGIPDFKISNLAKDGQILTHARNTAEQILSEDPKLDSPKNIRIQHHLKKVIKAQPNWSRIS